MMPAMAVVATAPIPGVSMPNRPVAGAMSSAGGVAGFWEGWVTGGVLGRGECGMMRSALALRRTDVIRVLLTVTL